MKLITDEEELVSEVCEAEEIKESISTSIAHISQILLEHFLNLLQ